jgi:hypothetical protein
MSDPLLQMGGDMNELMSTRMCSPMMIYLAVIVTTSLSVYITRNQLKKHNTNKMENLNNLYTLNELKLMIIFGLILFGLCQYNKETLAWVFLVFPVIYLVIQNLIIHIHVSSAVQSAPKEAEGERRYGVDGGAMIIPQDTQQVKQQQQVVHAPPPPRSTELPVTTSMSQPLGMSQPMGMNNGPSGFGGGGDAFAYF